MNRAKFGTPANNSPKGFFRYTPDGSEWHAVAQMAKQVDPQDPRIYYRVRQCQLGFNSCLFTAEGSSSPAEVPHVLLGDDAIPGACAMAAGPAPRGMAKWALGWLVSLVLFSRRRRRGRPCSRAC